MPNLPLTFARLASARGLGSIVKSASFLQEGGRPTVHRRIWPILDRPGRDTRRTAILRLTNQMLSSALNGEYVTYALTTLCRMNRVIALI